MEYMADRHITTSADHAATLTRGRLLRRAGAGAAGLALGGALPGLLNRGPAAISFAAGTLNVSYWSAIVPEKDLLAVFNGFAKQQGVTVKYQPLPQVFGDDVQKLTTALSSGYTGYDVLWLDDFMTGTFSTAGWLVPLENVISKETQGSVPPATIKLSTYNGHLYRLPGNAGDVIFFYRKDLFDKKGLSAPKTWNDIVKAGLALTGGGRYGIGFAGKNGNTELFNEMCYWMGQAGADPLHLKTAGARTTLKFVYDMINTHKIAPPDTVAADYTSLSTAFQDSRFAMWPVWDGFLGAFQANAKFWKPGRVAIIAPPKGPVNNSTITASWGWSISKFSPNKDLAAKFIQYATQAGPEELLALTGSAPARTSVLSVPSVQKVLHQANALAMYAKQGLTHNRPITGQAQRISDAFEQEINQYLNKQISLDTAINDAQAKIDQILQNS
jgi:multiple sugar transport system substrate-binding protein